MFSACARLLRKKLCAVRRMHNAIQWNHYFLEKVIDENLTAFRETTPKNRFYDPEKV